MSQDNLDSSTDSIKQIGHHREVPMLTYWALVLCSEEGLMLEISASESLYNGQFPSSTQMIKPKYPVNIVPEYISWVLFQDRGAC